MSPDEAFVLRLVQALRVVDLEYVIVGWLPRRFRARQ